MKKTLLLSYDFYRYGHGKKYALTLTSNTSKLFQAKILGFFIQKVESIRSFGILYKIVRALLNGILFSIGLLYFFINKKHFSKIHFLDGEYLLIGLLCKITSTKTITTLHNPSIFTKGNTYSRLISKLYKKLNSTFIVHGDYSKLKVEDFLDGNVKSINYPVSTVSEVNYQKSLNERKFISFIGILRKNKNIFKVIDIFNELLNYRSDFQFLIAGYPLEYSKEEIQSYISNFKGLEKYVVLNLEYLSNEDYEYYLEKTKVLVHTYSSDFVSASGPVADAIGYGIPVVARDIGQVGSLLKDNNLGKVIENTEPENYKNAILDILNPSKYLHYSNKAFEFSQKNDWKSFKEKHMEIYSE